jgi:glyoxylase-like metal-dependent hydrolase (beta-lactamase superfamily II)
MKKLAITLLTAISLFAYLQSTTAQSSQPAQPKWCQSLPRPQFKSLQRIPLADTWFEVYEVSPSVFAIYEPRQSEETIGYLIAGSKRAILFDTGMGIGNLKKLISELTKLPVIVLNSHTHGDHVGDNWQFPTIYGMDTDFTRLGAKGSNKQAQEEIQPSELCGDLPAGFDVKTYSTRPWKITKYIHDGEQIDLGGRSLEVIATPGHTPDAICLFDSVNGLLFTGDTYYPGTIYLFAPETDLAAYDNSVRRLAALAPQVRHVLGAHNFPWEPPDVLSKLAVDFEAVRAGKVPAISAGPGKVIYKAKDNTFLMKAPE